MTSLLQRARPSSAHRSRLHWLFSLALGAAVLALPVSPATADDDDRRRWDHREWDRGWGHGGWGHGNWGHGGWDGDRHHGKWKRDKWHHRHHGHGHYGRPKVIYLPPPPVYYYPAPRYHGSPSVKIVIPLDLD